jgi:hypothetical protein
MFQMEQSILLEHLCQLKWSLILIQATYAIKLEKDILSAGLIGVAILVPQELDN